MSLPKPRTGVHHHRTLELNPPTTGNLRLPRAALHSAMPAALYATLVCLARHQQVVQQAFATRVFHIGRYSLAGLRGIHANTARAHLAKLEALGLVTRLSRGGYWNAGQGEALPTRARGIARTMVLSPVGQDVVRTGRLPEDLANHAALLDRRKKSASGKPTVNTYMANNRPPDPLLCNGLSTTPKKEPAALIAQPQASPARAGKSQAALEQEGPARASKGQQTTPNKATARLQAAVSEIAAGETHPETKRLAERVSRVSVIAPQVLREVAKPDPVTLQKRPEPPWVRLSRERGGGGTP